MSGYCKQCGAGTTNKKFCSRSCSGSYSAICHNSKPPRASSSFECLQCGVKKLGAGKFCSKSCAGTYNGYRRLGLIYKNARKITICVVCKKMKGRLENGRFCSNSCRQRFVIQEWLAGRRSGTTPGGGVETAIRLFLFEEQKGACDRCKRAVWMGVPIPLELEHRDGNHLNNDRSNVCLLCPNCHGLTSTYGSKNRGKGRPQRKKYSDRLAAALKKAPA